MKKAILTLLVTALLTPTLGILCAQTAKSATFDHEDTYTVTGFDTATAAGGVYVYPNGESTPRVIGASEYGFRNTKVMIFDGDGLLIEAGGDLLANEDGTNGSPQTTVTVPAGGFLVAFDSAASGLYKTFNTAMEGAMLYNATMSVIYEVRASYSKSNSSLTVQYNDPEEPSDSATSVLFVGNSTTYFNGTPIKLKALAAAAGMELDVTYCTFGSAYLSEFADETHERGKALRSKLSEKQYDYVVLQDAGSADYSMSKSAMETIMPLIRENGATALLYMRYSSSSTAESRLSGAADHYKNYSKLAEDYGLSYAPVCSAFLICTDAYPEINLYADDNSHHSAEGSYLIACTWLYAYFGIDPRGNSYTANLPAETVAALQDCAVKACDEGYDYPELDTTYTVDGVKYENIAIGKSYTSVGDVYSDDKWTDTSSDGTPIGKRTDGEFATSGDDTKIGCMSGTTTSITIDLEDLYDIKAFRTDLWGGTWGIPDPNEAKVEVAVSADGTTFTDLGEMARESVDTGTANWKSCMFTMLSDETVLARYVRVTYTLTGKFCWSSEAAVYGTLSETQAPDTSDTASDDPNEESTSQSGSVNSESTAESSGLPETGDGISNTTVFTVIAILIALLAATGIVIRKVKGQNA